MSVRRRSNRFLPNWLADVPPAVLLVGSVFLVVGVVFVAQAAGLEPSPRRGMIGLIGFAWVFGILVLWRWLAASTRLYRLREGLVTGQTK